jgi:hypothetical protein
MLTALSIVETGLAADAQHETLHATSDEADRISALRRRSEVKRSMLAPVFCKRL